jgi:hypothetical protein
MMEKNLYERYFELEDATYEIDYYIDLMYDISNRLSGQDRREFFEKIFNPIEDVCEDMGDIMWGIRNELGLNL